MYEPHETAPLPPAPALPAEPVQQAPSATFPFRLLHDERVLATYPITDRKRALGHLKSFLFVTDSRVIYAAESKTVVSSSAEYEEHRLDKIDGIETHRRRGFSALGAAITVGIVLNLIWLMTLNGLVSAVPFGGSSYSSGSPFGLIIGVLIALSIAVGAGVVLSLLRPTTYLGLYGPDKSISFAESRDWVTIAVTAFLFVVLGPIALLFWLAARGLGLFQASDAFLYADVKNIEAIAYDAGAMILDAQARGTLAGS